MPPLPLPDSGPGIEPHALLQAPAVALFVQHSRRPSSSARSRAMSTVAASPASVLTRWLRGQGVTLLREDTGRANGCYLPREREIAVHRDLVGVREVKTLAHEAAHFATEHAHGVAWADAETVAEGRQM